MEFFRLKTKLKKILGHFEKSSFVTIKLCFDKFFGALLISHKFFKNFHDFKA